MFLCCLVCWGKLKGWYVCEKQHGIIVRLLCALVVIQSATVFVRGDVLFMIVAPLDNFHFSATYTVAMVNMIDNESNDLSSA